MALLTGSSNAVAVPQPIYQSIDINWELCHPSHVELLIRDVNLGPEGESACNGNGHLITNAHLPCPGLSVKSYI